jgi:hypothetical protein
MILPIGDQDYVEGQPFLFSHILVVNPSGYYEKNEGKLRHENAVPSTWMKSAKKERWILESKYIEYDLNEVNLLNKTPFDKTKTNLIFYNGHETPRTRKIKEDREREQAEKQRQQAEEQARISAENERIAAEKRQEESRKWQAEYDAKAPERAIKEAEEKRVREADEESLRQRIDVGEPATRGNIFIDDRVKRNGDEATVTDELYEIKYPNGDTEVVKLTDLINMSAVERTIKQNDRGNGGYGASRIGGTRRRRRKNRKTRYGMETRS